MSEQRFTPKCNFQKCQFISHIKDNEKQVVLDINEMVDLLNEQQATINELTKNRDKWRELAKLHTGYSNCLEKAIERAYEEKPYPKIEDIMDIYSELEKEFENEQQE